MISHDVTCYLQNRWTKFMQDVCSVQTLQLWHAWTPRASAYCALHRVATDALSQFEWAESRGLTVSLFHKCSHMLTLFDVFWCFLWSRHKFCSLIECSSLFKCFVNGKKGAGSIVLAWGAIMCNIVQLNLAASSYKYLSVRPRRAPAVKITTANDAGT